MLLGHRVIKSRRVKWAGYVASMRENASKIWLESLKGKDGA